MNSEALHKFMYRAGLLEKPNSDIWYWRRLLSFYCLKEYLVSKWYLYLMHKEYGKDRCLCYDCIKRKCESEN